MDLKRCATCFGYFTGDPENCPVCARHEAAPDDLQASIHALSADFASLSAVAGIHAIAISDSKQTRRGCPHERAEGGAAECLISQRSRRN